MATQAESHAGQTFEEHTKRLRVRKVYIQLRIPRVRAEITALVTRKKALSATRGEASKEVVEEKIYNNQHLVALRKELDLLEQERKSVLEHLRKYKEREKTSETNPSL